MRVGCQFVVVHGALAGYELFVDGVVAVGGVDVASESEVDGEWDGPCLIMVEYY